MKTVKNKLIVRHYPQLPCGPYEVAVKDEYEAAKIIDILALQHCFLFDNKIIPDYCNSFDVVMWDSDAEEWVSYWNEDEQMDWDDFETEYLQP